MTNHACPLCGHQPQPAMQREPGWQAPWCNACGFGSEDFDALLFSDEEGANRWWGRRVRRELAQQALALRAHTVLADGSWLPLPEAQAMVMHDYAAANPLRLPGEDT